MDPLEGPEINVPCTPRYTGPDTPDALLNPILHVTPLQRKISLLTYYVYTLN